MKPLIIQYTNLLHKYRDPAAKEVVDFVKQYEADEVFLKRVAVLNKVWLLKSNGPY
jgi:hypothetical protein